MNINDLFSFLNASPTAFHAAEHIVDALSAAGFTLLRENEKWDLRAGGKYCVVRNASSVIAFITPEQTAAAMPARIVATHLDSPALKVKLHGMESHQGTVVLPTEIYGGPIISTWLDRPLGLAGRLVYEAESQVSTRLYSRANVAVIPNAAIHLNHDINTQGATYNPQRQLNAIVGLEASDSLASMLELPEDSWHDSDLYLFDAQPAAATGPRQELINAPRLDNLLSAYTALLAMTECGKPSDYLAIAFWADNEEIGSMTKQGAASNFLETVYRRVSGAFQGTEESFYVSLAESTLLSADAAHAAHPNYMELYEPHYTPLLGHGIAIKRNAQGRYATHGECAAKFRRLCRQSNIPCQDFINRADMPCGSTIGPRLSSALGIDTIDLGIPMLAMHSIRETAAWSDVTCQKDAFDAFLQADTI